MIEKNSSMRQLIDIRLGKLNKLKDLGIEPFPHKYNPTHKSIDIISSFDDLEKQTVCVAGRIMALRKMGKASFIHVMDDKGKIQIFIKKDNVVINIYSIRGYKVDSFKINQAPVGSHVVNWNAKTMPSGVYFVHAMIGLSLIHI